MKQQKTSEKRTNNKHANKAKLQSNISIYQG